MSEVPPVLACPTCRRPVPVDERRPATFPFCGARCRTTDLGAWATGGHVIAGTPLSLDGYDADLDQLSDQRADPDRS